MRVLLLYIMAVVPFLASQGSAPSQPFDVVEAGVGELQEAMDKGLVTSVELVRAYLARIEAYDQSGPHLNAMIRLNPEALARAEEMDRERERKGTRGPLHGIPIVLKDNYDTRDMPTTGASVSLAGLVPADDAFQVRKLRQAGAVILGKTNLHELAAGITSISSLGGQTRNPYDPSRNPGGSSGGTAAAVAASFAAVGMGSDTCGSIRIPAAHNNLVGLRPSKGLSSIDGIIPLSHTQDTGGPLARTIADLAVVLDATMGYDPADPATEIVKELELASFSASLDARALDGARIGVLTNLFGEDREDEEVAEVVRQALAEMERLGAVTVEITIPDFDEMMEEVSVIGFEFKFDLADYLNRSGAPVSSLGEILDKGLHHVALEETFRRRNAPEKRDSEEYRAALAKRQKVRDKVVELLDRHLLNALAYPTIRRRAAHTGERQFGSNCQLSAFSGVPAISIPAGFTGDGFPVGIELLGAPLGDTRLVALGYAFEQATGHRRAPDLTPPLHNTAPPAILHFEIVTRDDGSAATLTARFTYHPVRGVLEYDVQLAGIRPAKIYAVNLHLSSEDGGAGPVIGRLLGPGVGRQSGSIVLRREARDGLREGRLKLVAYTENQPLGGFQERLKLP